MCNEACLEFGRANLRDQEVRGKFVLEVGALDVNGSLRPLVMAFGPAKYVGVDLQLGPGVDEICNAEDLVARFGAESVDVLISNELLEHVRDWRPVVHNFKQVLKPGGILLVTTRSRGFPYHGFPHDFWRYEPADFQTLFADFAIEVLERDPLAPGVFLKATKPLTFREVDTRGYALYSVLTRCRVIRVRPLDMVQFRALHLASRLLPYRVRRWLKDRRPS
jgi:SAM-dependent methyltransferase